MNQENKNNIYVVLTIGQYKNVSVDQVLFLSTDYNKANNYYEQLQKQNPSWKTKYLVKTEMNKSIIEGVCNEDTIKEQDFETPINIIERELKKSKTPLQWAVENREIDKFLAENTYQISHVDRDVDRERKRMKKSKTPLQWAVENREIDKFLAEITYV